MKTWLLSLSLLVAACRPVGPPAPPSVALPERAPAQVARYHLIDVGQGAAALIELPCGAVLVDTGGETNFLFDSGKVLREYLERFFERRRDLGRSLDLVVLTHPHLDHTRNVEMLAESFEIKNVVTGGIAKGSGGKQQAWLEDWASKHARYEFVRSDAIPPGGLSSAVIDPLSCQPVDPVIRVLWGSMSEQPPGWPERAFRNHNNHSVVVSLSFGRASFIVSGDLEEAGIDALLARHRASGALDVDVWQVGHHGSYNATTAPLLEALTPKIALIPMGTHDRWAKWTAWKFGHPRKKAIDLLLGAVSDARPPKEVLVGVGVETFEPLLLSRAIYGTGWDGHVVVSATPEGNYTVETSRVATR